MKARNEKCENFFFSFLPDQGWRYLFLSILAVTAAMLCKEQGITICGICAVYEIFVVQKVSEIKRRIFLHKKVLALHSQFCIILQVNINDIKHLIQTVASGKTPSLATSWWPSEATRRLVVICLSTLGLLLARLHIMGSQLPVFTR